MQDTLDRIAATSAAMEAELAAIEAARAQGVPFYGTTVTIEVMKRQVIDLSNAVSALAAQVNIT